MPLDRPRAEEEPSSDLRVRQTVARKPGDLRLLGRELVAPLDGAPAHLRTGGEQLAAGALSEPTGSNAIEELVGGTEFVAGVHSPVSRRNHSPYSSCVRA